MGGLTGGIYLIGKTIVKLLLVEHLQMRCRLIQLSCRHQELTRGTRMFKFSKTVVARKIKDSSEGNVKTFESFGKHKQVVHPARNMRRRTMCDQVGNKNDTADLHLQQTTR